MFLSKLGNVPKRLGNSWGPFGQNQYWKWLRSFTKNENGGIAVIFALASIPIIQSIGAAIDVARIYVAKAELGEALDKAALAVGVSKNATEAQVEEIFQGYFEANYGPTSGPWAKAVGPRPWARASHLPTCPPSHARPPLHTYRV